MVLWEIATVGNKIKIANTFTQCMLNFSFIRRPFSVRSNSVTELEMII